MALGQLSTYVDMVYIYVDLQGCIHYTSMHVYKYVNIYVDGTWGSGVDILTVDTNSSVFQLLRLVGSLKL